MVRRERRVEVLDTCAKEERSVMISVTVARNAGASTVMVSDWTTTNSPGRPRRGRSRVDDLVGAAGLADAESFLSMRGHGREDAERERDHHERQPSEDGGLAVRGAPAAHAGGDVAGLLEWGHVVLLSDRGGRPGCSGASVVHVETPGRRARGSRVHPWTRGAVFWCPPAGRPRAPGDRPRHARAPRGGALGWRSGSVAGRATSSHGPPGRAGTAAAGDDERGAGAGEGGRRRSARRSRSRARGRSSRPAGSPR